MTYATITTTKEVLEAIHASRPNRKQPLQTCYFFIKNLIKDEKARKA
jgi:hypothetical protein